MTASPGQLKVCVDHVLPAEMPLPFPDRLAARRRKRWKLGRTLGVRFLEGTPDVHALVATIASQWMEHANVRLEFDNRGDAEIRVAFTPGASWSAVGVDAGAIAASKPTMNLGWLTPATSPDEYERVVLHEFGHALGCIHEHQSPAADGKIPWNREAVYAYFTGPPNGWTTEQVDANIFDTYSSSQTQCSEFDPASIMIYPIPAALLCDPAYAVPWNTKLSDTDVDFIGRIYPRFDASLPRLEVGADALTGEMNVDGQVDAYRFDLDAAADVVVETHGTTDLAMRIFGPDSAAEIAGEDPGCGGLGGNARVDAQLMPGIYLVQVRHQQVDGWGEYGITLR